MIHLIKVFYCCDVNNFSHLCQISHDDSDCRSERYLLYPGLIVFHIS